MICPVTRTLSDVATRLSTLTAVAPSAPVVRPLSDTTMPPARSPGAASFGIVRSKATSTRVRGWTRRSDVDATESATHFPTAVGFSGPVFTVNDPEALV